MAKRVQVARKRMRQVARAARTPELLEILRAAQNARLKLNNEADLTAVADKIADAAQRFSENHDGTQMAAIDDLIPAEDKYKGEPSR